MIGYVARQSWAGLTFSKCEVLKVNPKRSRVRFLDGAEKMVPNEAIRKSAKPGSPPMLTNMKGDGSNG